MRAHRFVFKQFTRGHISPTIFACQIINFLLFIPKVLYLSPFEYIFQLLLLLNVKLLQSTINGINCEHLTFSSRFATSSMYLKPIRQERPSTLLAWHQCFLVPFLVILKIQLRHHIFFPRPARIRFNCFHPLIEVFWCLRTWPPFFIRKLLLCVSPFLLALGYMDLQTLCAVLAPTDVTHQCYWS
jgi:hypothetical protein